jgi:hypothetical protein
MFNVRERPLLLVADRLFALRLSLNAPVVATPDLPAGPARAAIVVHGEGGRTCFTVAVRSLRNGASVLYELEGEDANDASGIHVALDAALSFAESMGFLFDDELITARTEPVLRAALAKLREIVAMPGPDADETGRAAEPSPPDEILLEEALEQEVGSPPPSSDAAAPAPAPVGAAPLTKFRAAVAADAATEASAPAPGPAGEASAPAKTRPAGGRALLGRVKPVRLRAPEGPPPVPALLRLLSHF